MVFFLSSFAKLILFSGFNSLQTSIWREVLRGLHQVVQTVQHGRLPPQHDWLQSATVCRVQQQTVQRMALHLEAIYQSGRWDKSAVNAVIKAQIKLIGKVFPSVLSCCSHSDQDVCKLYCFAEGYDFFFALASKVKDGTLCYQDSSNVCIDGLCEVMLVNVT